MTELVEAMIVNIALLTLIANALSKIQKIQHMILMERRSVRVDLFLSCIFGGLIIVSNYLSIDVGSYSLNARIIGAMASGLLGGPLVGFLSSMLGAAHTLFFFTPKVFARGAAFSTILCGLLGAGFYPYFQRGKWKYRDLFVLACFGGLCEMISLLRMTVKLDVAVQAILDVTVPMIVLNAFGLLIFVSSFNTVFLQQDIESSRQLQRVTELAKRCMPLFQDGLCNTENMHAINSIVLAETDWTGVMITDRERILDCQVIPERQENPFDHQSILAGGLPDEAKRAMDSGELVTLHQVPKDSRWYETMQSYSIVAAPFIVGTESVGCMLIWFQKKWVFRKSMQEFFQHFVTNGSVQLTRTRLEEQNQLTRKAEFRALQFQVNPHFLFNALNTISSICRENSEKARDLLLVLANYFRYDLRFESYLVPLEEEINHVQDYLEIEKARFEEKLSVRYEIDADVTIEIPTLILQPIVENAVRYGIDNRGNRSVDIRISETESDVIVEISDCGKGFAPDILEKFRQGQYLDNHIGLTNVHKRLKNAYGEDHGLQIQTSEQGTTVGMRFKKQ